MKRTLLFLCISVWALVAYTQDPEPPCWYTPNWDWTNLDVNNWKGYWQGQDPLDDHNIDVPWATNGTNGNVFSIANLHEYRREQGWVLLWKDFGCPDTDVPGGYPHFFLYNKLTSIVRCFYYVPEGIDNVDQAKLEISWHEPENNTSLLTHANQFPQTNDKYPVTINYETAYIIIEDNTGQGWIVGEFMLMFDHRDLSLESAFNLKFALSNLSNSILNANATFSFTTESKSLKNANTSGVEGTEPGTEDEAQADKNVLGNVDWEAIQSLGEQIAELIPEGEDPQAHQPTTQTSILMTDFLTYINITEDNPDTPENEEETSKLSFEGIEAIGDAIPYVKVAFALFDIFAGKPSKDEEGATKFRPTVSSGSLKLNGTITTSDDAVNRFIDVPGMDHQVNSTEDFVGVPIYDCPLGNLALEKMPMFEKTTYSAPCGWWADNTSICDNPPSGYSFCFDQQPISIPIDSYRITEDVIMALNKASELSVDQLWAGLFTEDQWGGGSSDSGGPHEGGPYGGVLDNTGWYYGLTTGWVMLPSNGVPTTQALFDGFLTYPHSFSNPLKDQLLNGTYIFNRATAGEPLRYGTPMIPLEKFKNTALNVTHGNKVYLKIGAVMTPDNDFYEQSSVLWEVTFELTDANVTYLGDAGNFANNTAFPYTWEQMEYRRADIVTSELDGQYEINIGTEPGVYIRQGNFSAFDIIGDRTLVQSDLQAVNFAAEGYVKLVPGFRATAATNRFRAYINRTSGYISGENAEVIHEYNQGCVEYPYRAATYNQGTNEVPTSLLTVGNREGLIFVQNKQEWINAQIKIFDAMGKLVFSIANYPLQNFSQFSIGALTPGIYIYTQQTPNGLEEKKFIIAE